MMLPWLSRCAREYGGGRGREGAPLGKGQAAWVVQTAVWAALAATHVVVLAVAGVGAARLVQRFT